MAKKREIVLAGTGGQGLVMAGILLGQAATNEGYFVAQTQSYGIATRGGVSFSEVVIGDEEIVYPKTTVPDVTLALTEETFKMFFQEKNFHSIIIVDSDSVPVRDEKKNVVALPLTKYCREIGNMGAINLMGVGAVVGLTDFLSVRAMEETIKDRFPKKYTKNLEAFRKGFHLTAFQKRI